MLVCTSFTKDFTFKEKRYRSTYKMECLNLQDMNNSVPNNGTNGLERVIGKFYLRNANKIMQTSKIL